MRNTTGFRERLAEAITDGPNPMSERQLGTLLEDHFPDMRGATYGTLRLYRKKGGVRRPRVDILGAMAQVLGVREDWLAFNEGAMTEDLERARLQASAVARGHLAAGDDAALTAGREFQAAFLGALQLEDSGDVIHSWTAPLMQVAQRFEINPLISRWLREVDLAPGPADLGRLLRAPLEILGIDSRTMPASVYDAYIFGMLPVLITLAKERTRQLRGLTEDQAETFRAALRKAAAEAWPAAHSDGERNTESEGGANGEEA